MSQTVLAPPPAPSAAGAPLRRGSGVVPRIQPAIRPLSLAQVRDGLIVAGASLAIYLVLAWMVVFRLDIFVTDSMSRTLHAWQVFFSGDPKLTHIGFIWAPLPTLLQLPLVLLPPLRTLGFSGNVLTALMGAFACWGVLFTLQALGVGRRTRLAMVALYAVNPMIAYYSANGLSEITSTAFTIWSIGFLVRWVPNRALLWLFLSAFSLALACLSRYDSLLQAALMVALLPYLTGGRPIQREERRALLIAYLAPVTAAFTLWLLLNLMIMGNPLHFAKGDYSNAAQIGYQLALQAEIAKLTGNPSLIAQYLVRIISALFPAFSVGLALVVLTASARGSRLGQSLALLALTFPAFQALNFMGGQTAAFLRYFLLAIPFGVILLGYAVPRLPGPRALVGAVALLLLAGSNVATAGAMRASADWGQWNEVFVDALATQRPTRGWQRERDLAAYLSERVRGRDVLVDDFQGYRIVFFTGRPDWFVGTGDRDFEEVLRNPVGRVRYVLVHSPLLEGALNKVNIAYPTLYDGGAWWAELDSDWSDDPIMGTRWRLYRVLSADELTEEGAPPQ